MIKNSIVIAKKIPNSLCLALEKWNSCQRSGLILMIYLIPFHRKMKKQGHCVQSKTWKFHSLSLFIPHPQWNFQVYSKSIQCNASLKKFCKNFKTWKHLPEQFYESWNSTGFEYGKQPLSVMGQIMHSTRCTSDCLQVVAVSHGSDEGWNHLRGVHDSMAWGLFLGELVHHHSCLAHHNLKI